MDKILLEKFLNNKCTEEELYQIREFLKQPEARELFDEILNESWADLPDENPDAQQLADWKMEFSQLRDRNPHASRPIKKKLRLLSYAAVLAGIIFGVGFLVKSYIIKKQQLLGASMLEMRNPYGQRSKVILPDSSIVYLGAGSSIKFPRSFDGKTREVRLQGEAYFEVVHHKEKAFIVDAADVQTCVLGTSFKIEAFKDHPVTVSVTSGKVSVGHVTAGAFPQVAPLAVLLPGQNVSWDAATHQSLKGMIAIDETKQWKQGKLVFHHTSLKDMSEELERWYNVKIIIERPERAGEKISGDIPTAIPVNEAMDVLSITGHFNYSIKNSTIKIY